MTVTNVEKDLDARTLTLTAEFAAPVERVWALWADPRKLERWWGPPMFPATFVEHALVAGADVRYYMTSPEGERYHGWWKVLAVAAPRRFEFEDGFADEHGQPNPELPVTHGVVTLDDRAGGGTRMVLHSTFGSREAMEQTLAMGLEEGITLAMNQMDAILAEG